MRTIRWEVGITLDADAVGTLTWLLEEIDVARSGKLASGGAAPTGPRRDPGSIFHPAHRSSRPVGSRKMKVLFEPFATQQRLRK